MNHRDQDLSSDSVPMNDGEDPRNEGGSSVQGAAAVMLEASMVCMSVVESGPRIAFCAYQEDSNRILMEECVSDGYETHSVVERVLATIRPTLLLLSSKIVANQGLLEILTTPPPNPEGENLDGPTSTNTAAQGGEVSPTIPYRLLKTSAFEVRACRAAILNLRVRSLLQGRQPPPAMHGSELRRFPQEAPLHGAPTMHQQQHHPSFAISNYHALATLVDFDSPLQIQALGSLLSFLQSTVFCLEQNGPGGGGGMVVVNDIVQAQACLYANMSAGTLSALHIFATEHHPLLASKGGGSHSSKEGFSLYSLLSNRTKSSAGRQRLREWMLKPLVDVHAIALRQDGVELFLSADICSPAVVGNLQAILARIGPADKVLCRIQKCSARPNDFLILIKTLEAAVSVMDILQGEIVYKIQFKQQEQHYQQQERQQSQQQQSQGEQYQEDPPEEQQLSLQQTEHPDANDNNNNNKYMVFLQGLLQRCHIGILREIHERVSAVVDEDASKNSLSVVVRPGYHQHLDARKEEYEMLQDTLLEIAVDLRRQLPHLGEDLSVAFLPQIGYLVGIERGLLRNEDLPDDFDFVFDEENRLYFKNTTVRHLDETIGDVDSFIKDTEALIVAELEEAILECEGELRSTFHALSELECIIALASCAADLNYVRPEVLSAEANCIEIQNGRHPLQEVIMESDFVPNSTNVTTDNRVNIVTGPNFSGKSCYARQVGILTYMAQIGSFIPCESARISVVDQIFASFSSVETCSVPQSSFQLDLSQMGSIARRAGKNSLVIVDEFGKGTSPKSGIALLTTALRHFASVGCKVVCTTHFLEIFSMGLIQDGTDGMKALRMAVHVPESTEELAAPLFLLEAGVATSSAGLVCAKMAGVKQAVIDRAGEIIQAVKDRHKVQPLLEILRGNLNLSPNVKEALAQVIGTNWKEASDEQVDRLLHKLHLMKSV